MMPRDRAHRVGLAVFAESDDGAGGHAHGAEAFTQDFAHDGEVLPLRGIELGQQMLLFFQPCTDGGAAVARDFAAHEVERLNAVGTFVNGKNARIAVILRGAGFLDETHAAVNLHA